MIYIYIIHYTITVFLTMVQSLSKRTHLAKLGGQANYFEALGYVARISKAPEPLKEDFSVSRNEETIIAPLPKPLSLAFSASGRLSIRTLPFHSFQFMALYSCAAVMLRRAKLAMRNGTVEDRRQVLAGCHVATDLFWHVGTFGHLAHPSVNAKLAKCKVHHLSLTN